MNIFFSGIGGVGIGPLAEIAHDAGFTVAGSDLHASLMTKQLEQSGIRVAIGQDGSFLREVHNEAPLDWFVYTSALPADHPELLTAQALGIKTAKRDELLAHIITEKNLKLIAVSGTHGKTTTTGMLIWAFRQLGIPVSYSVGTTISFGKSGLFDPRSEYFIYECDEFDRNFLHFRPHLSLVTSLGYDHPDTYPTEEQYKIAFRQFLAQSEQAILWQHDASWLGEVPASAWQLADEKLDQVSLPGVHTRQNATLAQKALEYLQISTPDGVIAALNDFPGTDRRFEKLAPYLYTDYGHHPAEIAATLQMAHELSDHVVLVYQPHQNIRQHEIINEYTDEIFKNASEIYWLPTYLTRENPDLPLLTPEELTAQLSNKAALTVADFTPELWNELTAHREAGHLVLCMGAGAIDEWVRKQLVA